MLRPSKPRFSGMACLALCRTNDRLATPLQAVRGTAGRLKKDRAQSVRVHSAVKKQQKEASAGGKLIPAYHSYFSEKRYRRRLNCRTEKERMWGMLKTMPLKGIFAFRDFVPVMACFTKLVKNRLFQEAFFGPCLQWGLGRYVVSPKADLPCFNLWRSALKTALATGYRIWGPLNEFAGLFSVMIRRMDLFSCCLWKTLYGCFDTLKSYIFSVFSVR